MRMAIVQPAGGVSGEKGGVRGIMEPMGACYIAAALEEEGHKAKVIHQIDRSNDWVLNEIREFEPDAVGFSVFLNNLPRGIELAKGVKKEQSDVPLIFGGYGVSGAVLQYSQFPDLLESIFREPVDVVVYGEGEKTICDLVACLEEGNSLNGVDGIVYKKEGTINVNGIRDVVGNLDVLPFPKRSDLPMERYFQAFFFELPPSEQRFASVSAQRGCRFSCDFCSTPQIYGNVRGRSAKNVVDELEMLVGEYGTNTVWFSDEDFFNDKERISRIFELMEERHLEVFTRSFARATDITQDDVELLEYMKENGYRGTLMGIEFYDDKLLRDMHKGIKTSHIRTALDAFESAGISVRGAYMVGHPHETEEQVRQALDNVVELPMDEFYIGMLTPFPGTKLYSDYRREDKLTIGEIDTVGSFSQFDCRRQLFNEGISTEVLSGIIDEYIGKFHSSLRVQEKLDQYPALRKFF